MLDQLLEWRKMLQSCSHRLQVCIQNSATPVDSRNLTELTSERSSAFTKVNVKPCQLYYEIEITVENSRTTRIRLFCCRITSFCNFGFFWNNCSFTDFNAIQNSPLLYLIIFYAQLFNKLHVKKYELHLASFI